MEATLESQDNAFAFKMSRNVRFLINIIVQVGFSASFCHWFMFQWNPYLAIAYYFVCFIFFILKWVLWGQ